MCCGDPGDVTDEKLLWLEGDGETGSSASTLYVCSVAMDVLIVSEEDVSNRVVEKFGIPHWKHIQLTFGVSPL